jgi:hypothetical protein
MDGRGDYDVDGQARRSALADHRGFDAALGELGSDTGQIVELGIRTDADPV